MDQKRVDSESRPKCGEQVNITNIGPCAKDALPLSVASDEVFSTTPPLQKSSEGLNKKKRCRIPQQWTIRGDTASTDIGVGNIAIVDLADLPLIQGRKWFPLYRHHNTYASHGKGILMHRLVSGVGKGQQVDHEDNNGLNNRRLNLRIATQNQNRANSRKYVGASKYKGVCRVKGKWRAFCGKGQGRYLGTFQTEGDAARAYDAVVLAKWGNFSKLNFPQAIPLPTA